MDSLRLVDYLLAVIMSLLGIGWVVLFYSLRQNAIGVKEAASLVLTEKDKTAALVLTESKSTAALVLTESKATTALVLAESKITAALVLAERDRLALQVKSEHNILDEKLTAFRIKVAEEYSTTTLLEKLLKPIIQQLNEIEKLLHTKVDRQEFADSRRKDQ